MALDAVTKIQVICHSTRIEEVMAYVEATGMAHLQDLSEAGDTEQEFFARAVEIDTGELSDRLAGIDRVISFLDGFSAVQGSLMDRISYVPPRYTGKELMELLEKESLVRLAEESWRVAMDLAKIEGNEKEQLQEQEFLRDWINIPCDIQDLRRQGEYRLIAGTAGNDAVCNLYMLEEEVPLLSLEEIGSGPGMVRVLAAYHCSIADEILQKMSEQGFSIHDFGSRQGPVSELLAETESEIHDIAEKEKKLEERARELAEHLPEFRVLRDAAGLLMTRLSAQNTGRESDAVVQFKVWIRKRDLELFSNGLEALGEVMVEEIELEENETIPSPLTESQMADPYVMLTDMFGQPERQDPDPTPLMAPFFALFFGICIGDAGYGITLALGSAAGWFFSARRGGNPRLFKLLFQGGLASILVGVFLGGWFGISFDSLPSILQAPAEIFNSIVPGYVHGQTDQETFGVSKQFLYVTLALGLFQLAWGVVVNLSKRLRAGEGFPAVLDQSGWLLAEGGLFPWLFNHYLLEGALYNISGPADKVFLYMLLAGAVLIFVMGGREGKGFGKIGLGAYAAYGIINLLGDVLSYSRLFALALSSAIIALVINQIAGMLMNELGIPVVGVILAVLVLAGGHLFNLFMAALSGFIHTARLQFVEFFGKFYDGTGMAFKPLKYKPVFINIKKSNNTH